MKSVVGDVYGINRSSIFRNVNMMFYFLFADFIFFPSSNGHLEVVKYHVEQCHAKVSDDIDTLKHKKYSEKDVSKTGEQYMTIIRACLFKFKHSIDDFKITLEEKRNEIDSNKIKLRAQVKGANETMIIRI